MDIEIFKYSTLKKTFENAKLPSEREHVHPICLIQKNLNVKMGMQKNYSKYRFCIDFKKDYLLFKKL